MIDLIKKSMLAGIGAAVVSREAAEKALKELVDKGKISTEEARKAADRIIEEGRQEFEKSRGELTKLTEELLQKGNLVTQSQLAALEKRVEALEEASSPGSAKKKAKSTDS